MNVVVPGYYLVWYNQICKKGSFKKVVVPGYYLVWYNCFYFNTWACESQFPVITWYGIMFHNKTVMDCRSQFPVITWYGIIKF